VASQSPRPCVLIVAHQDNFVEIFGSDGVDVRFVNAPTLEDQSNAEALTRCEILAEDYISSVLPQRYRDIYFPSNRIATRMIRTVTPLDLARHFMFRESWKAFCDPKPELRAAS